LRQVLEALVVMGTEARTAAKDLALVRALPVDVACRSATRARHLLE